MSKKVIGELYVGNHTKRTIGQIRGDIMKLAVAQKRGGQNVI